MFTGIVEATGTVERIEKKGTNIDFVLSCPFTNELKVDQSVAHSGCCLTVTGISGNSYAVTAISETLEKTNLGAWQPGTVVNLERCLKIDGRLDGHIVQGHVDAVGEISDIRDVDGSHLISVNFQETDTFLTVPQGSITMNGVSLTVAQSGEGEFSVAVIPYTWEVTNLSHLKIGDRVNLEFDIIGKYLAKLMKKNVTL